MSAPFVKMYKVFQKSLGEEQAQEIVDELYKTIEEIKEEQATKEGLESFRHEVKEEFNTVRKEMEILKLSLEAKIEELRKDQQAMKLEFEAKIEELRKDQHVMRLEIEQIKKEQQSIRLEIEKLKKELVEKIYETKNTLIFWIMGTWLVSIFLLFFGKIFKIY